MKGPIFLFTILLCAVGCARQSIESKELAHVQVGMTKQEVRDRLGRPSIVRSSYKNSAGKLVEVHEYKVNRTTFWQTVFGEEEFIEHYWLQFQDGKLVKWERGEDPQKEADKVVEMRVKHS